MDSKHTHKILIVDDDPLIAGFIEATLRADERLLLLTAQDGEEALAIAKRERPDMVLLDIAIPKLNGYQVCRALRADPDTRHARVIMVTALWQEADLEQGLEAGADDYFIKPFNPVGLLQQVRALLEPQ